MIILRRHASALALLILLGGVQTSLAQTDVFWTPASGNWDDDSSWDSGFLPDTEFDETAVITNGGVVTVDSSISPSPGHIILGQATGETGTLIIENNGNLAAEFTEGNAGGAGVIVGGDGDGFLTVNPGGTIGGRSLIVGGLDGGSVMTVGAAAGAAANVNISEQTTISRQLRVIGPNVNFSTQGFSLFSTSVFVPQITSSTHSAINVSGTVSLDNGILRPEFTNGVTPSAGDTWNLFDAGTINGGFTVDTSNAPVLPFGQVYSFSEVEDGSSTNGRFGQLAVEQRLVLNVNRETGAVSIQNGPVAVDMDSYEIKSALGGLNPAGWNSLQNQALSGWRESPQGGSSNALAELNADGAVSMAGSSVQPLGSVFQLPTPTEFGTELEDITFEYFSPDGDSQGIINYIGNKKHNNLVLLVDPDTGDARIENQSTITVDIQVYTIGSESGSLLSANGQWDSLDDQGAAGGDWRESNPTANVLTELKEESSTTMSDGVGFDLGTLFQTELAGGTEDLTFQFLFPGEDLLREGIVEYRSFDATADFDLDGDVDGTDLAIWQGAYGTGNGGDTNGDGDSDGSDFLAWQRQFTGSGAVSAVTAVPEPSTLVMLGCLACPLSLLTRRGRNQRT